MNKNFDSAIKNAFDKEFFWLNDFENPYADYQFSRQFKSNMESIIPTSEYTYVSIGRNRVRKSMLVALIALLAFAITGCAVVAHYIVEWKESQNDVQGTIDIYFDIEGEPTLEIPEYVYPNVPDGFIVTDEYKEDGFLNIKYENNASQQISYSQFSDLENMSLSIDNEDAAFEETTINGHKGYTYSKEGINALYWADGVHFYILQGTCEIDILLKMSESMT